MSKYILFIIVIIVAAIAGSKYAKKAKADNDKHKTSKEDMDRQPKV